MILRFLKRKKTWDNSQQYELNSAINFMKSPHFISLHSDLKAGKYDASKGGCFELVLKEFFDGNSSVWKEFVKTITGKRCMDIGPCVMSPIAAWDVASERITIEPLYEEIDKWQKVNLGWSCFYGMKCHAVPAEKFIPEYADKIDGVIYCRNMLDHTNNWPFVLANISEYAASNCTLMLWTDLYHDGLADEGHYEITPNDENFRRLLRQLGFIINKEFKDENRKELNYGCIAIKR